MAWPLFRLAYIWISQWFVLATMYRHERVMWIRMNAMAALMTPLFFWPILPLPPQVAAVVEIVGIVLVLAPYPLGIAARRALGQANWQAPRADGAPETITTAGPYGRIRHPLYLVMFVGSAGQFMVTGTWFCVPLILIFAAMAYTNALHDERKIMTTPLAEAYAAYKREVPSRFVPGVL